MVRCFRSHPKAIAINLAGTLVLPVPRFGARRTPLLFGLHFNRHGELGDQQRLDVVHLERYTVVFRHARRHFF